MNKKEIPQNPIIVRIHVYLFLIRDSYFTVPENAPLSKNSDDLVPFNWMWEFLKG